MSENNFGFYQFELSMMTNYESMSIKRAKKFYKIQKTCCFKYLKSFNNLLKQILKKVSILYEHIQR